MRAAVIIAEYNPFHSGHRYHITETKRRTKLPVIAVMSPNFVQRGECALFPKKIRAQAAILNGCDLVLELPTVFAVQPAEIFARAGVQIADATGICEYLSFGSESADLASVTKAAQALLKPETDEKIAEILATGVSYPAARQMALGEQGEILSSPNDILATEYVKSIIKSGSSIRPLCVKREGSAHDSGTGSDASSIRKRISSSATGWEDLVPENAVQLYHDSIKNGNSASPEYFDRIMLSFLRRMTAGDFRNVPDVSEGLEYRMEKALGQSSTLQEFYESAKTKRYTLARIRRASIMAVLGIDEELRQGDVPYIRPLAFNGTGRALLREMKTAGTMPIVSSYSEIKKLDDFARRVFSVEALATDLYDLFLKSPLPAGEEMRFVSEYLKFD